MTNWQDTATTDAYELAGIPRPASTIEDEMEAHKRFIMQKQGELCDLERCAVCLRIFEDWVEGQWVSSVLDEEEWTAN